MTELSAQWANAFKVAKKVCGKNPADKKAFAKLIKPVESKLESCLESLDKAITSGDAGKFKANYLKAKPLLIAAEAAYKEGLEQKLYTQNEVRAFFAAVTQTKPDSINGHLKTAAAVMAKAPAEKKDDKDSGQKAKADAKSAKADAKRQKEQDANRKAHDKKAAAVLKVIAKDKAVYDKYRAGFEKLKMAANERNGDIITAYKTYEKEILPDKKAAAADDLRAQHEAAAKLIKILENARGKPPTTSKSDKAVETLYPVVSHKPADVAKAMTALAKGIESTTKEMESLVVMLKATMDKNQPPTPKAQKDADAKKRSAAKAAEDKAEAKKAAARRKEKDKRDKKQDAADAKNKARQEKFQTSELKKDKKVAESLLKLVKADAAKVKEFGSIMRKLKMEAVGADGDLREARDRYEKEIKPDQRAEAAAKLRARREQCAALSKKYKQVATRVPSMARSQKAIDKLYPHGRIPGEITDELKKQNTTIANDLEELNNLHIMLDRSLSDIRDPR